MDLQFAGYELKLRERQLIGPGGSVDLSSRSFDWKLVQRTDGTMQWTYDGKPVYFFKDDAAKGDVTGDGKGGVWHVINE